MALPFWSSLSVIHDQDRIVPPAGLFVGCVWRVLDGSAFAESRSRSGQIDTFRRISALPPLAIAYSGRHFLIVVLGPRCSRISGQKICSNFGGIGDCGIRSCAARPCCRDVGTHKPWEVLERQGSAAG